MPFEMNMQQRINNVIKDLGECGCCEKHKRNRPKAWEPWEEQVPDYTLVGDDPQNCCCRCPCRHNARILCRMHPNCPIPWDHESAMQKRAEQIINEFQNNNGTY